MEAKCALGVSNSLPECQDMRTRWLQNGIYPNDKGDFDLHHRHYILWIVVALVILSGAVGIVIWLANRGTKASSDKSK